MRLNLIAVAHHRLPVITCILASAHLSMAVLHAIDRAAPAIPPTSGLSGAIGAVDDWWWVCVHLTAAALLEAAVISRSWLSGVVGAVVGAMTWGIWGALLLAWSLDTIPPVSLVAPLMVVGVALPLSLLTAAAWGDDGI